MNSFIEDIKEHCQKNLEVRVNSAKLLDFVAEYYALKAKLAEIEKQSEVGFIKHDGTALIYYKDSLNLKPDDKLYAHPVAISKTETTSDDLDKWQKDYADWFMSEYHVHIEFDGDSVKVPLRGGRSQGRTVALAANVGWSSFLYCKKAAIKQ